VDGMFAAGRLLLRALRDDHWPGMSALHIYDAVFVYTARVQRCAELKSANVVSLLYWQFLQRDGGPNMVLYMPFHPVLEAFSGNWKIMRHGTSTANQHVHQFPDACSLRFFESAATAVHLQVRSNQRLRLVSWTVEATLATWSTDLFLIGQRLGHRAFFGQHFP